ncbi:uncharacterized protein LOC108713700 isoform X2 [Xenopus laevis]|uniref:Uncharacterized protein LOC108713700 isoform X2 n=1 Tax=Xenopus laevis TaxID=8355 RepID=A0A8J1MVU3_XENLA|nr:uncharacterized protein LOC108713700 isoform X2 [Xenopus laevis]
MFLVLQISPHRCLNMRIYICLLLSSALCTTARPHFNKANNNEAQGTQQKMPSAGPYPGEKFTHGQRSLHRGPPKPISEPKNLTNPSAESLDSNKGQNLTGNSEEKIPGRTRETHGDHTSHKECVHALIQTKDMMTKLNRIKDAFLANGFGSEGQDSSHGEASHNRPRHSPPPEEQTNKRFPNALGSFKDVLSQERKKHPGNDKVSGYSGNNFAPVGPKGPESKSSSLFSGIKEKLASFGQKDYQNFARDAFGKLQNKLSEFKKTVDSLSQHLSPASKRNGEGSTQSEMQEEDSGSEEDTRSTERPQTKQSKSYASNRSSPGGFLSKIREKISAVKEKVKSEEKRRHRKERSLLGNIADNFKQASSKLKDSVGGLFNKLSSGFKNKKKV